MSNTLSSFTDILGDEIENSQPISLPSSTSSHEIIGNVTPAKNTAGASVTNRPAKGTGQYGQFRSVEEIDPKYRNIFKYSFFNVVQSRVIDDALYSDKSLVICAPTGSGKTVIFEMAIVQLLMSLDDKKSTGDFKIVYMAPVKALCTERLTEWYPKFTKHGLLCIEVTGDTDVDFSQLKPYRIIITTPEKWDMLTRRWRDHKSLVEVIKLFLIDEVHILNDETRGPVLEAVVSRMKTIESSVQSTHRIEQIQKQCDGSVELSGDAPRIRFVAVSATVSNPEDVASWLGTEDKPAAYFKFGDECRPVKLKRVVEGYPCAEGTSIFKFDIILNYKLWPIIQKYHDGKPTLIFCNTRKSVVLTAETLSKELTINFNPEQKARLIALASTIKTKKLQSLIMSGVGCHHAGMLFEERINIEQAFRNRDLPILITTTTLAMGVNLPAHLVIIKNTQQYVNGAYQEYSISTVLQMVGRAGRPQYDTEATAVIMTRLADKHRYEALVGGNEPLQSFLHKRLPENLNSEAALGTVGDVAQCVQWLRSTFLFVRSARDPRRYLGLPPSAPQSLISKKIEELCVKAMNGLATSGLITMDEASCIESTDAGRLMSIYYLDVETMKNIMKIDGAETLERLLAIVCDSHEMSDMHLRVDERRCLNALNRNNTAATIRFPMKGKINTRQMKLNCIIQAILGCLPITDPSLNQEAMKVMRVADRICKCLVAYVTRPDLISQQPKHFSAILNSIILAKCVTAHLWENSPFVSKQLKGIGPAFSTLLATAGKVNFMLLKESHPRDLERIMNKGPPAGNTLRKQISLLPQYNLTITPRNERTISLRLVLENQCYLAENIEYLTAGEAHKSYIIVGDSDNYLLLLTSFKDKDLISIYDGTITYEITRKRNCEHKIFAHCVSSNFVGIDVQCEFVFEDLEPPNINIDTITKNLTHKQTYITDVFKERKRKNEDNLETPQSKDKRRRDSTIIQKFTELKEPFNQTFESLNQNMNREKILPDISCVTYGKIPSNNNNQMIPIDQNSYTKNNVNIFDPNNMIDLSVSEINLENSYEDIINDEQINNILDSIESEICEVKKLPKIQALPSKHNTICQKKETSIYGTPQLNIHKKDIIRHTSERFPSKLETHRNMQAKARKTKNVKSNYSFIDILEKNDCVDEKDNTIIATDNAIGFSNTIKTNIDKYLAAIYQSSTDSDNVLEKLLPNTQINNCLIPNTDLVSQHISPQLGVNTSISGTNLDQNYKTLGEKSMTTQITTTVKNMDNLNQKNKKSLLKESTTESPQIEKLTLDDEITKLIDLRDDNTLIGSLQENSSTVTVQQNDTDFNKSIIRPESTQIDANMNYGVLNPKDNNSNYLSENSRTQNMEITANFNYENNTNVEGKCTVVNEQPEFVDSNKIKQLSRDSSNVGNYVCVTDCISKYSFKSTTVKTSANLVQIIKKLKVNLDIIQNISTNKLLNNRGINDTCPTICRAVEKPSNCMIAENNKNIDHYELTPTKSYKIEKMTNDVQTMPKCTDKEFQKNQIISNLDNNCKETMCDGKSVRFYENVAEGQKCSHDCNIANGLPDVNLPKCGEVNNTNLITETDQYINLSKQKCEDNNIADILKKYSTMIRNNNKDQDINNNGSTIRRQNKNRQETRKPDRPFKICDIQKLDINLPQALINQTPTDDNINNCYNFHSIFPIVKSNILHQNEEKYIGVHTVTSLNSAEPAENIQTKKIDKISLEDEDNELIWPASVEYPQEATAEFNIHDSMFDPKTLLQCLDNDKNDVIIPPPQEFRDNVNFNYSTEEIISDTYSPKTRVENHIESDNSCIFSNYNNMELTPCEETETLILSPEMSCDNFSTMSPGQTCITMDRNFSTNKKILHNPPFSRRIKLNQFKFSQKKKMKI